MNKLATCVAALLLGLGALPNACANKLFASPQAAMTAFGDAVALNDDAALRELLGSDFREYIPPLGTQVRHHFLAEWARSHAVRLQDKRALVEVGSDGWTLPIPIVQSAQGWQFDTLAGADEMRIRRIGRNELSVMQTLLAIRDAQIEYAAVDRDGDGILAYASKLSSSKGKRDGLYWPTREGEPPSPVGTALAAADTRAASPQGYFGYHYKLLTSQGPHAPGGALDYLARGKLFGGFAVIAWPARYGDSGVKTFIISHDGQIYERDLGPDTAARAAATKSYDPGPGWAKAPP